MASTRYMLGSIENLGEHFGNPYVVLPFQVRQAPLSWGV